ncbi:MAG TPA: enoyl-CoA hydratase-related protein [Kofleriaceae bacterium]|jgi:enoyl-CoA hydratase|nr:enoyl-CoA hydratase-related protein [Kofleriaceae bacterium]
MFPTFQTVAISQDGPLGILTIDRAAALNALSTQVMAELGAAAVVLEQAQGVRVVALTGAGDKAFVAGADISEMHELTPLAAQRFVETGTAFCAAVETSTKPWIAAVNGVAFGGGCELALACDFIYAAESAKFGQPEVKLGVIPGLGGTQRLLRRVGVAKTKELCMTGDAITAAEALRIGLCDLVVPAAELMATVKAVAGRIAANGPIAVAEVKRLVQLGQSAPLDVGLAFERQTFAAMFATRDQREGMAAFLAKPRRAAAFEGK